MKGGDGKQPGSVGSVGSSEFTGVSGDCAELNLSQLHMFHCTELFPILATRFVSMFYCLWGCNSPQTDWVAKAVSRNNPLLISIDGCCLP